MATDLLQVALGDYSSRVMENPISILHKRRAKRLRCIVIKEADISVLAWREKLS